MKERKVGPHQNNVDEVVKELLFHNGGRIFERHHIVVDRHYQYTHTHTVRQTDGQTDR